MSQADSSEAGVTEPLGAAGICGLLVSALDDGLDHPELWPRMPEFVEAYPGLLEIIAHSLATGATGRMGTNLRLLLAIARGYLDSPDAALSDIEPLAVAQSQSPLVQGAVFHLEGLKRPDDPRYQLQGKLCPIPFEQMDVLDRGTHLCCASWLKRSVGDMHGSDWEDVWNSAAAEQVRASIHDGTYRYCNKTACPKIQGNELPTSQEVAARSPTWRAIVENGLTRAPQGPQVVNLAYDKTCNLSCPSCRTEKIAADTATRERFAQMQERSILPMLKHASTVFITGSGDPFASKNFRNLMERLGPEDYPDLRFQIMTNGMLFTRREWERFPALHGRVKFLRVSIDAATGPTHELLRRGARWPVMLENLAFMGELRRDGLVGSFDLVFVVQAENYREMGEAVDLAERMGADTIQFNRITNWGTFSEAEFAAKAVVMPSHPEHEAFLQTLRDSRLRRPIARLGNLQTLAEAA